ncbi:hypothetical protein DZA31_00170 [Arcobacter sp. HD9-500m-PIT-SAG02]|nr:hypothetical protein DZA31_00170 [Arcobacter sp. HD9-500m-PIT-SAG02]
MSKSLIRIAIEEDYFKGGDCELINSLEVSLEVKKTNRAFWKKTISNFHIQLLGLLLIWVFLYPCA